jgi:hypothetical protein
MRKLVKQSPKPKNKSGKKKWANAEQKKQSKKNQADWNRMQKEWAAMSPLYGKKMTTNSAPINNQVNHNKTNNHQPKSLNSWVTGPVNMGKEKQTYTGDQMIGICVMHKSCLQPVFNQQAAEDAAKMRR